MAGGRSMAFTFLEELGLYHAIMHIRKAKENGEALLIDLSRILSLPSSAVAILMAFKFCIQIRQFHRLHLGMA